MRLSVQLSLGLPLSPPAPWLQQQVLCVAMSPLQSGGGCPSSLQPASALPAIIHSLSHSTNSLPTHSVPGLQRGCLPDVISGTSVGGGRKLELWRCGPRRPQELGLAQGSYPHQPLMRELSWGLRAHHGSQLLGECPGTAVPSEILLLSKVEARSPKSK